MRSSKAQLDHNRPLNATGPRPGALAPGAALAYNRAMAAGKECPICSRLQDVETSFCKYLAPELDRPLHEAAGLLAVLPALANEDAEKRHVRRCPECGALYDYLSYSEYHMNGSEDSEELTRLSPEQAAARIASQARLLEELRRHAGLLASQAGGLGDQLDRAPLQAEERRRALAGMESGRKEAEALRRRLQALIAQLRRACPEILAAWAGAHARACRHFLETLPDRSEDERTARFVAASSLEAWERLAGGGDALPPDDSPWLPEYAEILDRELPPPE